MVGFLAVRALKNAGLAFRFDPAMKTLVMMGGDGKEIKISATGDGLHARPGIGAEDPQQTRIKAEAIARPLLSKTGRGCAEIC